MSDLRGPVRRRSDRRRIPIRTYEGAERRHSRRHRLRGLKVVFKRPVLWVFHSGPSEPCPVSNVTSRGVRFYTRARIKPHTVIEVSFDAPVGVYRVAWSNKIHARIIWQKWSNAHQAYRTGARFVHISKSTHEDLVRMLKEAALYSPSF